MRVSIVLPAKNEASGLRQFMPALKAMMPEAEIIVVNDGSSDDTAGQASALGATVLSNPYAMGNGASIKRGARAASGEIIVFMDADMATDLEFLDPLVSTLDDVHLAIGSRSAPGAITSNGQSLADG